MVKSITFVSALVGVNLVTAACGGGPKARMHRTKTAGSQESGGPAGGSSTEQAAADARAFQEALPGVAGAAAAMCAGVFADDAAVAPTKVFCDLGGKGRSCAGTELSSFTCDAYPTDIQGL